MKTGKSLPLGCHNLPRSGLSYEACPKTGFVFARKFCVTCGVDCRNQRGRALPLRTLPPANGLVGSGACPRPRGSKAIAIVFLRFVNSQPTRRKSGGATPACEKGGTSSVCVVLLFLYFLRVLSLRLPPMYRRTTPPQLLR